MVDDLSMARKKVRPENGNMLKVKIDSKYWNIRSGVFAAQD